MTPVGLQRSFALRGREQRGVGGGFLERDSHAAGEDARMRRLGQMAAGFEHRVECIAQPDQRRVLHGPRHHVAFVAGLAGSLGSRLAQVGQVRVQEAGGGIGVVVHGL